MRRRLDRHVPRLAKLDVDQLRGQLAHLASAGEHDRLIEVVLELISKLHADNLVLQTRLLAALRKAFGRSSEKVSNEQLSLLFAELAKEGIDTSAASPPTATSATIALEATPSPEPPPPAPEGTPEAKPDRNTKTRSKRRTEIPAEIPRDVTRTMLTDEERACPHCGDAMKTMGFERSEMLEFVPSSFRVLVTECEKASCPACRKGVTTVEVPAKPIEGARPGPGLLAQILTARFREHSPYYRQMGTYLRFGVYLPDSTIGAWAAAALEQLAPVAEQIHVQIVNDYIPGIDATGIRVLDRDAPEGVVRGTMWVMANEQFASFHYATDASRVTPKAMLADRPGLGVQADGTQTLDFVDEPGCLSFRIACGTHARRKFHEALEAGERIAIFGVHFFRELYDVERRATEDKVDADERLVRRQRDALPVLDRFRQWIVDTYPKLPPRSRLAKACKYLQRRWLNFVAYAYDGRIPIDNSRVERAIRGLALGRKNWLFAGSGEAAERTAIAYTLVASCALNGVEPFAYLRDTLDSLAKGWPNKRLRELLPDAYAERQQRAAAEAHAPVVLG